MSNLVLEAVEGPAAGRTFDLDQAIEVGREPGLAVVLDDEQVSRHHARLTPGGTTATVEDLGSTNGTYLNGRPVQGPGQLGPGDQLRVGLTVFELRTRDRLAVEGSGVRPAPQVTRLGANVLQPARTEELAPAPPATPSTPGLLAEATEPAFVPASVATGSPAKADPRPGPDAITHFLDSRVKQQTGVAAFAILAIAAILLVIFIGLR